MKEFFASYFDNLWLVFVVVGALLLALAEAGFRVGLRLYETRDEPRKSQITGVQGAVLGLLALLLGFTFSMAVSRYERRRELVVKEANAIGTTYLRAGMLPETHRAPVKELLRLYIDVRLKGQAQARDAEALADALRRSAEIQAALWQHAEAAAAEAPTPIVATFINALNDVIDTDAERQAAGANRIPIGVSLLLLSVAGFGCFTSAYGSGAYGARSGFTKILLPLLITIVFILIFDLMHTGQGTIDVSQQPLKDLQESLSQPPAR